MTTVLSARLSGARYEGRIDAELSYGDAILIIRDGPEGDGSIVCYSAAAGVLPRNWASPGSTIEWTTGGLVATHEKKGERLEIFVEKSYFKEHAPDEIDPHLEKIGREQHLADVIAEHPDLLGEEGLELVGREVRTEAGPMDLLLFDASRRPLIIETKRRRAALPDLWQLKRYEYSVRRSKEWGRKKPRGILVAPSATRSLLEALKAEKDFALLRLSFEDVKHLHRPAENPAG